MSAKTYREIAEDMVKQLAGDQHEYWWNVSHRAFGGLTPNQMWEIKKEKVLDYLSFFLGK